MFTGIVSAIGTIRAVTSTARGLRLTIAAPYRGLAKGESIAVDGACLTVVAKGKGSFAVEAVPATRGRTKLDAYVRGTRVNLERAVRASDRLGGHFVAGHVDGVGTVKHRRETGDGGTLVDIEIPEDVFELCVPHGSIAIDGVSLTVNALPKRNVVQVSLIPHTLDVTTLGGAGVGHRVHLEADLIGKFVRQLTQGYRASGRQER